ncbi:hypothetical protein RRF57_008619 [Xylaria bambusicola]|uniref:Small ribosomal subunit protein uS15 N-terminal domain-containing protein n=1 Tax=Xylaria bambusicola TaxID=326684 RepID=A0AAN7UI62_9PEZI
MGRKGKGISSSALPYSRAPPSWSKATPDQVEENIIKLARKGATPSQIGVVLRDSHGIAQVKAVTGNKILRILKFVICPIWRYYSYSLLLEESEGYLRYCGHNVGICSADNDPINSQPPLTSSNIGETYVLTWSSLVLIKKHQAVSVRKHLERNRKDKDAKFHLILIESSKWVSLHFLANFANQSLGIHRLARYVPP